MSDLIVLLEELHTKGNDAALDHFEGLSECFHKQLPEPLWADLPKTKDDMAGIFTASTETVYLSIFNNLTGYVPVTASFEYQKPETELMARWPSWRITQYLLSVSPFMEPYIVKSLADAVVLSRKVARLRAVASVPETTEAVPARLQ